MFQEFLTWVINYYRKQSKRPLDLLETLYKPFYPRIIIAAKAQDEPGQPAHLKYGEIYTDSFAEILKLLNPKKSDLFCDLGSGSGKAVLTALITTPIGSAVGYEINPELVSISEDVAKKSAIVFPELQHKTATFHCQDFHELKDLSAFRIVYVAATCFWGEHWSHLLTLLDTLPEGAVVILTSRELSSKHFQKMTETKLSMSWGVATVWVYFRI
jgi:trans-aconitate methyltransferase